MTTMPHDLYEQIAPMLEALTKRERQTLSKRLAIGLRKRQQARIASQQNPDGSQFKARKRKSSKPMFQKLPLKMKMAATADGLQVGFDRLPAHIAGVHQHGKVDRVSKGGPFTKYPVRILLGWSDDDREWVIQTVERFIQRAIKT